MTSRENDLLASLYTQMTKGLAEVSKETVVLRCCEV